MQIGPRWVVDHWRRHVLIAGPAVAGVWRWRVRKNSSYLVMMPKEPEVRLVGLEGWVRSM